MHMHLQQGEKDENHATLQSSYKRCTTVSRRQNAGAPTNRWFPRFSRFSRSSIAPHFELFLVALRLGVTSFGGPIAHIGYFYDEYVVRRKWLTAEAYTDIVALCQFLPGPASSQVGMTIGLMRAGIFGALASWLGFTLPSAIALYLFSQATQSASQSPAGWLHGLLIAAVAIVAQAIWSMAGQLAADRARVTIAVSAAVAASLWAEAWVHPAVIIAAAFIGWRWLPSSAEDSAPQSVSFPAYSPRGAIVSLLVFFLLLCGLPLLRTLYPIWQIAMFDSFYRAGSLVFGGGHVVLPLLQAETVPGGWVSDVQFLAGYGAAQAVPGPLFTFAAYLGGTAYGLQGAWWSTVSIFLPSFLLVAGTVPFWDSIRRRPHFRAALRGVHAAVIGLLLAAFFHPVWTKAIHTSADFSLALVSFSLLQYWRLPPWAVVVFSAVGGAMMAAL